MTTNDGSRPSRLTLDRHATGETSADVSDVSSQAHLAAVEAERARVPAFDFAALQARAAKVEPERPRFANRAFWLVPLLAVAAALLLVVRTPLPENRVKGEAELDFVVLDGGHALLGDPTAVYGDGDRVQIRYTSAGHDRLVLVSVDGTGHVTAYYPDEGEDAVPVVPGGRHLLDASIILDDAPGPEVFVAFFGDTWNVSRARATVRDAWERGGTDAVLALEADPDVALLALEKE